MRVKICGIRNEADLNAAIRSGADAVGFLIGQVHPSPDFILPGTAARLVLAMPPFVSPVLVTHLTDPEEILDLSDRTGITTVQLHGGSTAEEVRILRDNLPPASKIILTVHFQAKDDFLGAKDFFNVADAFLIDSMNGETGQVGGTGRVNDWNLAAEFVKESPLPVILAGGLNPSNVADAIRQVNPFAVDANTGMKQEGTRVVDPELCAAFVKAAKNAAC